MAKKKNDGGAAFPTMPPRIIAKAPPDLDLELLNESGMSLREYAAIKLRVPDSGCGWLDEMIRKSLRDSFAGQALVGLITSPTTDGIDWIRMTRGSFAAADHMLAERDKK